MRTAGVHAQESRKDGGRPKFVLVITGKGRGPHGDLKRRGVLKRQVPRW